MSDRVVNHSGTSARDPHTRSGPLFEILALFPLKMETMRDKE